MPEGCPSKGYWTVFAQRLGERELPGVLTKVENAVTVEPVGEFALKGIRRPMMAYNVP